MEAPNTVTDSDTDNGRRYDVFGSFDFDPFVYFIPHYRIDIIAYIWYQSQSASVLLVCLSMVMCSLRIMYELEFHVFYFGVSAYFLVMNHWVIGF